MNEADKKAQNLKRLGPAAVRLARTLGLLGREEAGVQEERSTGGENQTSSVLERATVIEDAPRVEVPSRTSTVEGVGAPPAVHKPRWILTVARGGPLRLATLLYRIARGIARTRRMARRTGVVVFHLPVEMVAQHLGVDRTTVWRWAKVLKATGILDWRTHYGTLNGTTVATGTVWAVRIRPGRAKLTYDDLKHPWRNLEEDIRQGATAWAWRRMQPDFTTLLLWALGARRGPGAPAPEGAVGPWAIPYLQEAEKGQLPGLITAIAEHLEGLLRDYGNRRYYAGLLWKVVRGELNPWALLNAIQRVQVDMREGWARRPGALLASRLRA